MAEVNDRGEIIRKKPPQVPTPPSPPSVATGSGGGCLVMVAVMAACALTAFLLTEVG